MAAAGLALATAATSTVSAQETLVQPRSAWGADLLPTGPLPSEAPGDVRFLLVHHTAGENRYGPGDVVPTLRSIYRFHTGRRGWPDVAYNFFVDRYGGVWEGRTGSLEAPIIGDATGGNQGFSQLCCFMGNHESEPPTPEAWLSMTQLLAMLADRYAIDTAPGTTTTFTSRGSNKLPAGETVTLATIAGHRDVSLTECPGDAAYDVVAGDLQSHVSLVRALPPTTPSTTAAPATTAVSPTTVEPTTTAGAPSTAGDSTEQSAANAKSPEDDGTSPAVWIAAGVAAVSAAGVGAGELRRRKRVSQVEAEDPSG